MKLTILAFVIIAISTSAQATEHFRYTPSRDLYLFSVDAAEAKAVLRDHGFEGTNHDVVAEWIEDAMREAALSAEIREGWRCPGESASAEPTEFQVLISTGGPALRLMGELCNGEPDRCWFEHQDWGTPWTRYFDKYGDARLWFAGLFYWGD